MASPKPRKNQELTRYSEAHWVAFRAIAFRAIGCSSGCSHENQSIGAVQMYHAARRLAPFAANRCTGFPSPGSGLGGIFPGFWSAKRFGSNLVPRPGFLGNGLRHFVNRFRQFRHGCLFQQNAEPVNTDSSHRSYQRAIILMTGLVLASLFRQDGETGEKGECHMNAEDPQRTSPKQRATKELVKFAAASLAPPAHVERPSCHP